MSSDKIVMDSVELANSGSTIQGNSSSLGGMVTQFYSNVATLTSSEVWSGEDAMEASKVADSMRTDLNTIVEIVNGLGEDFVRTADTFDATVEQNKSKIAQV